MKDYDDMLKDEKTGLMTEMQSFLHDYFKVDLAEYNRDPADRMQSKRDFLTFLR